MKIYNSLTRRAEDLGPLNPPQIINMYTCGVTVYDECHIGHARSLYTFDVIRRYLEYRGFTVNFVRNITDIDNKIINRANELKVDWKELVNKYIESYREDLELLGVRPGIVDKDGEEPRATKNIEDIKKYIQVLIDKGYAYVTGTGVYFSVRKFKDYGKLSGQSIDQMLVGVRKESDETKEDPLDFALWKISKPDEPSWPSQWGDGRPGWHIECSVMSTKFLKTDTLDIHAGGLDLIFPHHENEIAQSEAKSGKPFAKCWIHHGLLTINGQKMSKSLGNFITIKKFGKSFDLLKLLFLSAHYRHPVDYTDGKIGEMSEKRDRILAFLQKADTVLQGHAGPEPKNVTYSDNFTTAMDDDFNTPSALSVIFSCVTDGNKILENNQPRENELEKLRDIRFFIRHAAKDVFGLVLDYQAHNAAVEAMISEREKARKNRDFKKADIIRKDLLNRGIIIEDTKDGPVWRNKN